MSIGRIPSELVGGRILYDKGLINVRFKGKELERVLSDWEIGLDKVVKKLKTKKYSFVSYRVSARKTYTGEVMGLYLSGGFCYADDITFDWSLKMFQNEYKNGMKWLKNHEDSLRYNLDLNAYVVGALDYISSEIEIFNPLENK